MKRPEIRSWLSISDEAITEVAGMPLRPFLTDADVMLSACATADVFFNAEYGLRVEPHIPLHSWWSLAMLGIEIEWPEDGWPHPVRTLERPEDVEGLTIPEGNFFKHPALAPIVQYDRNVCAVTKAASHLHDGMALGPVTCAQTLRGDAFFLDLYESPERAHRLLDFATELHLRFQEQRRLYCGLPAGDFMHIADDLAGMISPALWPEFVLPYWKRIFVQRGSELGRSTRMLHSELMNPEQQMLAVKHLPITCIECGEDPNVTIEDMNATGLEYHWHIKALEMLNGTPEKIRQSYRQAADGGAPVVVSGIAHRGVPPENIRAFLQMVSEYTK